LAVEKKGGKRPLLFVKVSPDESDYAAMVETVIRSGFDGIVATNTTRDRAGLPAGAPHRRGVKRGPVDGPSTDVLRKMAPAARGRLIFIGVGGIFRAEEAFEKVMAGASLVELYTGFVYGGPTTPKVGGAAASAS
jgi:dihydroorotate dehydrogenase